MDLGVLPESPQGLSPRLKWWHARVLSSRAVAAVSRFPSRGSRDQRLPSRLSQEAFPRGLHTGLSHVPPWCESILGLKVEAVQGKQVSLEWTEISGRLWEWWHDPGVPLAFPVESASSWDSTGMLGILARPRRERIPPLEQEAETGLLWMWVGLSCFLWSGDGYVGKLPELQQRCEGPFGSSKVRSD